MAVKTPGSLGALNYVQENAYGTTPTTPTMKYGGFMITMNGSGDGGEEEQFVEGSRIFDKVLFTQRSAGFTAQVSLYRDDSTASYYWKDLIALAYNPSGDIPSFTAMMRIAADEWVVYRGCKVDSLKIASDDVGNKVTATINVKAKMQAPIVSAAPYTANTGPSSKVPITFNAYPVMGSDTLPARSFSITIENHLEEEQGISDGVAYTAGEGLVPQITNVELEYELLHTSAAIDNLKVNENNSTAMLTITHAFGGRTLTFGNCYLSTDDHPSRTQGTYTQTVRFHAGSVTVV